MPNTLKRSIAPPPLCFLVSLIYWPLFIVLSATFCAVSILLWLLTCWAGKRVRGRAAHIGAILWGHAAMRINPLWSFNVKGSIDPPKSGAVYVANHTSQLDILAMGATGRQFKFVSKKSLFLLPIYGWAMFLAGYIPLSRDSADSIKRMMRACRDRLSRGDALLLYPEGTRSSDGILQPFKRGAFQIAHKAGAAIIPVVIRGTAKALPKGSILCQPSTISISILETIDAEKVAASDPKTLCKEIHALFAQELESDPS